jgi:hypothetical protein
LSPPCRVAVAFFIAAANAAESPPSAQAETPAAPKKPIAATSNVNGNALDVIVSLLLRDMVPKASCWSFKAVLTLCPVVEQSSVVVALWYQQNGRPQGLPGGLLKQC